MACLWTDTNSGCNNYIFHSDLCNKIYLLHESEWNMERYFTSVWQYFHEPQASVAHK